MTPAQLARQFCANLMPSGRCLGARFDQTGAHLPCQPKPACTVGTERCHYYEECLLPWENCCDNEPGRAGIIETARIYRQQFMLSLPASERSCPDCGAPLPPHKQLCPPCALASAKATASTRQQRWRAKTRV